MTYTIYTYGGGETLVYLFNGIAALFGSGVINSNLLLLNGVLGALWVTVTMYAQNSLESGIKWLLWFLVATNILIIPKASVIIEDPITDSVRRYTLSKKVDNVPLVLALFVSSVNSIGKSLTEKIESVFTLPDYIPYHKSGMVFASRLFSEMQHFSITNPAFKANLSKFVNNCIVYDAMMGHQYDLEQLFTSKDIWKLVEDKSSNILGYYYKPKAKKKRGEFKTCAQSAKLLSEKWHAEIKAVTVRYGGAFLASSNKKLAIEAMMTQLPSSYRLLTGMSADAVQILQQQLMINTLNNAANNKLSSFNNAIGYATSKALLQQRNNSVIVGNIAAKTLPIMKSVFEALCYGSFIFIAFLMLLPNGYKTLVQYLGVVLWLQLWAPLYAIVNLIITLYARNKSMGFVGTEGLSVFTSTGLHNINADMSAMAGWLSMLIPFLSYGLLKGGVGSFIHLASSLTGAAQSAAASTANEITSGNFSMGNITQGVISAHNTSAFKHNTNVEHMAGQIRSNMDDGTIRTLNPDGTLVYQSGAGFNKSTLGTSVSGSNNISSQLNEAATQEQSAAVSDSTSLTKQQSNAQSQVANLMQTLSKRMSDGKQYDVTNSASESQSFNKTMRFAEAIKENFGVSEGRAFELAVAASTKDGLVGKLANIAFGVDLNSKYSSMSGKTITNDHLKEFAKDQGFTETFDKVSRSAASMNFGEQNAQENNLSAGISATVSNIDTLSSSKATHERNAANYSHAASLMQSSSFDTRSDLTQAALKYIANQPTMGGKDKIGMDTARKIMDADGGELAAKRQVYMTEFQSQRFNAIQNIVKDTHFDNAAQLNTAIADIKATDLTAQGQENLTTFQNKGAAQGLQPGLVDTSMKNTVNTNLKKADTKLAKAKSDMQQKGSVMKGDVTDAMGKNMFANAASNLTTSIDDQFGEWTPNFVKSAMKQGFNVDFNKKSNTFNQKLEQLSNDDEEK